MTIMTIKELGEWASLEMVQRYYIIQGRLAYRMA